MPWAWGGKDMAARLLEIWTKDLPSRTLVIGNPAKAAVRHFLQAAHRYSAVG
jgi:hypothetical protein